MDSSWTYFARDKKGVMRTHGYKLSVNWDIPLDNLMFYLLRIIFWYRLWSRMTRARALTMLIFSGQNNMTLLCTRIQIVRQLKYSPRQFLATIFCGSYSDFQLWSPMTRAPTMLNFLNNLTLIYAVADDPGPGLLSSLAWLKLIIFPSQKQIITLSRQVLSRVASVTCAMSHVLLRSSS